MKNIAIVIVSLFYFSVIFAQDITVSSPDGLLTVSISVEGGKPLYSVTYKNKTMLEKSPLGLLTNEGDYGSGLSYVEHQRGDVDKHYTQDRIKRSEIHYKANTLSCTFQDSLQRKISVLFQVSNNDIAFRYELHPFGERRAWVVERERTGFRFPSHSTAFLSNMMAPMRSFARTSPSYESGYQVDVPLSETNSRTGYVFPGLFRIGDDGWVLLSETGVRSLYCASHLSRFQNGLYTVEYPNPAENNGFGSSGAQIGFPAITPWRTITVGDNLKPIVETTIPFDVVEPLYEPSIDYKLGRSTWSWIIWQDASMNWDDQITFIDLAADLGWEYILIDANWDTAIGYDGMAKMIEYANSKKVDVFLWYNTNGSFNDAPQGPHNRMNTSIARKEEMGWLQKVGVKGIKVDFLGGDKQETMRLYEDILSDANYYGLMVIFHGCTLPRGWERMFPNFVGSEAVLASEMLIFSADVRRDEALYSTLHPFIRNAVASMEYGGVLLNKYLVKSNRGRNQRLTTDVFQLSTGILYQSPMQMFALTPNNLDEFPSFVIDFMKNIPTTWNETLYIAGYPGKHAVIARRHKDTWYISGVNAEREAISVKINLPMFAGQRVTIYNDRENGEPYMETVNVAANGEITVAMQPNGGFVITK